MLKEVLQASAFPFETREVVKIDTFLGYTHRMDFIILAHGNVFSIHFNNISLGIYTLSRLDIKYFVSVSLPAGDVMNT